VVARFRRDPTRNRVRRFGQALVLAAEMPADIAHLHAHFLHTPASVARYAALLRGLTWSCSAHAKDIWTIPEWEKREKSTPSAWITTCTEINARHLRSSPPMRRGSSSTITASTRGAFRRPRKRARARRPRCRIAGSLLAVGRAVDKKGFDDLLARSRAFRAIALDADAHRRRPAADELEAGRKRSASPIASSGSARNRKRRVLDAYRNADLFVLPCRVSDDGDRDGLPNVLLEAQSQKLACVSTRVSGIPELIDDGTTGVLVPPRSPPRLRRRLRDSSTIRRCASARGAGFARATEQFSMDAGADRLADRFARRSRRGTGAGATRDRLVHSPRSTSWNEEGRMQGRRDVPLSERGRRRPRMAVPWSCRTARRGFEPARARVETAELLAVAASIGKRADRDGLGRLGRSTLDELRDATAQRSRKTRRGASISARQWREPA
jgi:glycosyltransferase involved in cell wall biosynthesis